MLESLLPVVIGIVSGAFGYWFSTFFMQPILRYRDIKNQVLKDFIYYAQVVNVEGLDDGMQALFRERVLANRRSSAMLSAAIEELPKLYKFYLNYKGYHPKEAARHLIGYSNTTDYSAAHKKEDAIRNHLGLPKDP
ncbi:hypothetical protein [uncultured Desulfosarcina sp.]|uniref:hypothetical protein n=1 Tax=uncultured Desulfosarcina sp. TaxID=218289 RepID=UPI0029C7A3E7|nr:hypothetical protein [uncultured Desulfosarcina sp.]